MYLVSFETIKFKKVEFQDESDLKLRELVVHVYPIYVPSEMISMSSDFGASASYVKYFPI